MFNRRCFQFDIFNIKMQRWMFRSSSKGKSVGSCQNEQLVEQKIHRSLKCESCLSSYYIYGLGRISHRGVLILSIALLCILLTTCNIIGLQHVEPKIHHDAKREMETSVRKPTYAVYGRNVDSGYLKHVFAVFERLGFERTDGTNWDVLWAHMYPFRVLYSNLTNLKPHQKVNHFPGSGYITQKVDLATSGVPYIPTAFRIPADVQKLHEHAKLNPQTLFVQKSNDHRGISIRKLADLDLSAEGTFVQEYVDRPFLVDGHKFDIGVYTIQTSVDPLRLYIYNGDMILRFCPEKYYPFDPAVLDKYVVGDDYLPTWEVPSLQKYFVDLGFSMKDSLDAYLRDMGKDPNKIWEQIDDAIRRVYLIKEPNFIKSAANFKSKRNYFEMVRFDFVVDEDLNVYIMEANMSPNLSSYHFPPNWILYEQVLFNMFSLVGVGRKVHSDTLRHRTKEEETMQVTEKNLMVHPDTCARKLCRGSCMSPDCQLCKPCLTPESIEVLKTAYLEHINRQDCKRIFPPHMTQAEAKKKINLEDFSPENQLMYRWFQGKCLLDPTWC